MIYLSKLTLNSRSRRVQSELRAPYEMHRTLARAFGATPDAQAAARCLFRVDGDFGSGIAVLVQTRTEPDWSRVADHAGDRYFAAPPQAKEVTLRLSAGQRLAFRLRANPTKAKDGKRMGLYDDESRMKWLERKAQLSGFVFPDKQSVRLVAEPQVAALRREAQGCQDAVFSAALFEGELRVVDPALLETALESGIGAGKGFGFGLLSLAKL